MSLRRSSEVIGTSQSSDRQTALHCSAGRLTLLEGEVVGALVEVDRVLAGNDVLERGTRLAGLSWSALLLACCRCRWFGVRSVHASREHLLRRDSGTGRRARHHGVVTASVPIASVSPPTLDWLWTGCRRRLQPVGAHLPAAHLQSLAASPHAAVQSLHPSPVQSMLLLAVPPVASRCTFESKTNLLGGRL